MYNSHTDIWIVSQIETRTYSIKTLAINTICFHLQAGTFAAVTVECVVYPLDTLKTRYQSPNYNQVFKDASTGAIKKQLLFRGLYQGIGSVVLSTVPSATAFLTTYETIKSIFHNSSSKEPDNEIPPRLINKIRLPFTHSLPAPIMHGIASSIAEMASCLILTPTEVLKQNAQMIQAAEKKQHQKSATRLVLSRFRHHPWRLWSGYTALLSRNLPTTAIHFPLFEHIRYHMIKRWRKHMDKPVEEYSQSDRLFERAVLTATSAAISGSIVSIITNPVDVVKTRVMLLAGAQDSDEMKNSSGSKKAKCSRKGPLAVGCDILRKEGVKALFRGVFIRAGWSAAAMGSYLSLYETGRFYLENRRRERDGLA
ncbi:unnamed protein product [Penicillium olsonii]|uniref:Mitochondrial carrier protein n=1 Tax=Penicillium olsonii TaxID=99116 RepID=A0A9W4HST0_PENOL|nr:unnamed protein product [Penicillium olsonii]CAG8207646.1 unnamed protein product [Penicillium olsonii]